MTFEYRHVTVVRVIDGDTVELEIDLGNKIAWRDHFRLYGIDTPERGRTGASEATARLSELLSNGLHRVETFKPDKYGRWLAKLSIPTSGGELCVNDLLVVEGHAVSYFGGVKGAIP